MAAISLFALLFFIAATRKRCPQATEEEVKKKIGLFLATAPSRLKNKDDKQTNADDDVM